MKKVKVKDIGVQVEGKCYFKGNVFSVAEDKYEKIKDMVEVLEQDKIQDKRIIEIVVKDENIDIEELQHDIEKYVENYNKEPIKETGAGENQESDKTGDVKDNSNDNEKYEELEALRETAKKLGINVTHNMRKETMIKKIEEIQKAGAGENQNPDGE